MSQAKIPFAAGLLSFQKKSKTAKEMTNQNHKKLPKRL